jgi:hypothetical protein
LVENIGATQPADRAALMAMVQPVQPAEQSRDHAALAFYEVLSVTKP